MNAAHNITDTILGRTERDIEKLYTIAYKRIKKQASPTFELINYSADMTPQEMLAEAQKWGRLDKIGEIVTANLTQANRDAVRVINASMTDVYKTNYEATAKSIQDKTDFKLRFEQLTRADVKGELAENESPFKQIAIDNMRDRLITERRVMSALTSSAMKGESFGGAMKGVKSVAERNLNESARIAQTETTRIENTARLDAMREAQKQGVQIVKRWVSQQDERVRDRHARADGQQADIDRYFYVGGEQLLFPGDFAGSPENVINCRCYIVEVILEPKEPMAKLSSLNDSEAHKGRGLVDTYTFDVKNIDKETDAAIEQIRNESVENAIILSPNGTAYRVVGDENSVQLAVPDRGVLKDSIIIHNHPDVYEATFSNEDIRALQSTGARGIIAVSDKEAYAARFESSVTANQLDWAFVRAKASYRENMKSGVYSDSELKTGEQNLILVELAKLLKGFRYGRYE